MQAELYTDLAIERRGASGLGEGYALKEEDLGLFQKTLLEIQTEEAAEKIGRPIGKYYTLSFPTVLELSSQEAALLVDYTAEILEALTPKGAKRVLAVGLGNRTMTADAVGPRVCDCLSPSAQLERELPSLFAALPFSLAVISPGVTAQSGLEAAEAVKALSSLFRPDLILAVDALAARATERLLKTVQISSTGLLPGSGTGKSRLPLTEEFLGVPVLALGVPTVVNARLFVAEALGEDEAEAKIKKGAAPLFVSTGDMDASLSLLCPLLSEAINRLYAPADPFFSVFPHKAR